MNSLFRLRFFAILLFSTVFMLSGCKKDNPEPTPADVAEQVAGTYTYSELTHKGQTAPASETNLKGTITITRRTATTVDITFNITLKEGGAFLDDQLKGIDIRKSGDEILYEYNGEMFARGTGRKFSVNGYDTANQPFTLTATK